MSMQITEATAVPLVTRERTALRAMLAHGRDITATSLAEAMTALGSDCDRAGAVEIAARLVSLGLACVHGDWAVSFWQVTLAGRLAAEITSVPAALAGPLPGDEAWPEPAARLSCPICGSEQFMLLEGGRIRCGWRRCQGTTGAAWSPR